MTQNRVKIPVDARLTDSGRVPTSGPNKWPIPITARLQDFVDQVNRLGGRTNRKEFLAAIVRNLEAEPEIHKGWVERYRTTEVKDLVRARGKTHTFGMDGAGRRP